MLHRKRIGIIGSGAIASMLIRTFLETEEFDIAFVLGRGWLGRPDYGLRVDILLTDVEEALARPVDLVVEAAIPQVVRSLAPRFLLQSDVCAFSCTALADEDLERTLSDVRYRSGHRFFVPHGAVLGLDGIADGREAIRSVIVTTTKSGQSLGLDPEANGLVFEGSARTACKLFPRNVNVHAAVAVAGVGFDSTVSRIVAAPASHIMDHHIAVKGDGLSWDIRVASRSLGGVTGSYTPLSSVGSVRRILGGGGLQVA